MGFLILNGELVHTSAIGRIDGDTMFPRDAGYALQPDLLAGTGKSESVKRWYFINAKYLLTMGRAFASPRNRKLGLRRVHGGRWRKRREGMRGVPVKRLTGWRAGDMR